MRLQLFLKKGIILKIIIFTDLKWTVPVSKEKILSGKIGKAHLTTMLTRSQEIDDVWVVAKFTENLQFPSKVPVVIFGGIFWEKSQEL